MPQVKIWFGLAVFIQQAGESPPLTKATTIK
jgi:hypothetical protein